MLSPEAAATNTDATPFAESLGPACHYGFMVYSTKLSAPEAAPGSQLTITGGGLRDRAFVSSQLCGIINVLRRRGAGGVAVGRLTRI